MKPSLSSRSSRRKVRSKATKPVKAMQDQHESPPNSGALVDSVETFLENNPLIQNMFDKFETGEESVVGVAKHFHKMSRYKHRAALAIAYCVWIKSDKNKAYEKFVYDAEMRREKVDKRVSKLRIILENIISYGDDTKPGLRRAQTMYSRDEAAIRFLAHEGIGPDQINSEANKGAAGLDKWSKSWSKINKERRVRIDKTANLDDDKLRNDLLDLDSFEYEHISITLSCKQKGHAIKNNKYNISPSASSDQILSHLKGIFEYIQKISEQKSVSNES